MAILIIAISFTPNVGGLETHLDDLCEYLTKNGYQTFVVTYQPITTKARGERIQRKYNLVIHRIPWFGHTLFFKLLSYPLLEFIYLTPMLLAYSMFFVSRHKKEINVIHGHGLNAAFVTNVLGKLFKKRKVASVHAVYDLDKRPLLARLARITLSPSDEILTLANRSKVELASMGLDERKIRIFTYWVDQTIFRPLNKGECKRRLGWEGRFIVLFVGRLIEVKGVRLLVKVAEKLSRTENIHFAFIGDGPLADELKSASNTLKNVIFVGRVDNENLDVYYNAADLVAVPSIHEEGFGRVILESLSCGRPVVASNLGGIPEALDASVGVLVEPNVNAFEEKIKYLYHNSFKLVKLARNCRRYAKERFSEKNAKLIEESYH